MGIHERYGYDVPDGNSEWINRDTEEEYTGEERIMWYPKTCKPEHGDMIFIMSYYNGHYQFARGKVISAREYIVLEGEYK